MQSPSISIFIHLLLIFVFGSQEEIESLREKMSAQTSLVVVGGADDSLRVSKLNRQMEGVTQAMIDNMVVVCYCIDENHSIVFCVTKASIPY